MVGQKCTLNDGRHFLRNLTVQGDEEQRKIELIHSKRNFFLYSFVPKHKMRELVAERISVRL